MAKKHKIECYDLINALGLGSHEFNSKKAFVWNMDTTFIVTKSIVNDHGTQ